jgi:hypothetical protein
VRFAESISARLDDDFVYSYSQFAGKPLISCIFDELSPIFSQFLRYLFMYCGAQAISFPQIGGYVSNAIANFISFIGSEIKKGDKDLSL